MRTKRVILGTFLSASVVGAAAGIVSAQQPGIAARAGQALDGVGRGLKAEARAVGGAVRRGFDGVRNEVNRMGVGSRVYSRIHWDKPLVGSRIEVHVIRGGTILLRGTVPDDAAKARAVMLASDTVDVTSVIDELTALTSGGPTTILNSPSTSSSSPTTTIQGGEPLSLPRAGDEPAVETRRSTRPKAGGGAAESQPILRGPAGSP